MTSLLPCPLCAGLVTLKQAPVPDLPPMIHCSCGLVFFGGVERWNQARAKRAQKVTPKECAAFYASHVPGGAQ